METEGFCFADKSIRGTDKIKSYRTRWKYFFKIKKGLNFLKPLSVVWILLGSNQRPSDYESDALTI